MRRTIVLSVVISSAVSALLTAGVSLLLLPAAVEAQVARLQATAYVLLGPDGAEHGAFESGTNPQGQPITGIRLNREGALRVRMETGRNGPDSAALTLRDQREQIRIRLALAASLEPGRVGDLDAIDVFDADQRPRVHIGVDGSGEPFIALLDIDGNVTWSAP